MVIWRGINDLRGWKVEVTDPAYTSGVHRAWISDGRAMVRGHGTGDTTAAAVAAAGLDLMSKSAEGCDFDRWAAELIGRACG